MSKQKDATGRNGLIAKVKIGQKQLGMDDDQYRIMLEDRFEVNSCSRLNIPQLEKLVKHLEKLGAEYPHSRKRYPKKDPKKFYEIPEGTPHARQKRYIAALWHALGWKMSGLDYRCKSQFKVESFLWVNDQSDLQTLARDLVSRCHEKRIDPSPENIGR
ncbi:regulatory protein GemA [uncultured Pseudodesulfovibrio sp.]|uniref:regulatory protein GemA n=1 Tax=uncultured Pseudodesulfovibrio sp. TaxID=2035858 RepID=UPI0029C79677|nr:regulatory protein GemA [uncultured Pseudodesulfovibrio sp.]